MNVLNEKIEDIAALDDDLQFDLFQKVSELLNSSNKEENKCGRNYLIRVIDNWRNVPKHLQPIWTDLVESAGFYPYIDKYNMDVEDLDEKIRAEYHKSKYIKDKYFHRAQKELSNLVLSKQNVIVSAPTSFGKSLLIEEVIASGIYKNVVVIQPTLALLDETRLKLKKYNEKYKLIVRTSQEYTKSKGNIFLLTAERVLEYPEMPEIDLLIIDEFYKLSKKREDNRANVLNIAFLRLMKNPKCHFYLLGPNIDDISSGFTKYYNAIFYKSDYSLVCTETENKYNDVKTKHGGKVSTENIFSILDNIDDQSLIFCSSPNTARKLAFRYCEHLDSKGLKKQEELPLCQWIEENLGVDWSLKHCLSYGIGVHDGSMPKHITTSTIKYFNDGKLKLLFCTNTIIEGVNTSAKNVIYYDNKIGKRKVDYFDYANIRGRAGRLMEHCIGRVINLKKPPEEQKMVVDIPFYTQKPIDDEVLVNIKKEEVKPFNRQRYDEFEKLPDKLKEILKRNAVSIRDQLDILQILDEKMKNPITKNEVVWSDISSRLYPNLLFIFELIGERFTSENEENRYISYKWMAYHTQEYCYNKNISSMIEDCVENGAKKYLNMPRNSYLSLSDFKNNYPKKFREFSDKAIEEIFKFQKNWLQYKIPKWLNIVDSLQKYVAEKLGIEAGNYSFLAEKIENEFLDSNMQILSEYGVPSSAIQKILSNFMNQLKDLSEDQTLNFIIQHRSKINNFLTPYEIETLDRCL